MSASDELLQALEDDERRLEEQLDKVISDNAETFARYWHFGDGEGGDLFFKIIALLRERGFKAENKKFDSFFGLYEPDKNKKALISNALRKAVFEADAYRCQHCNSHQNLTVDHIYPESLGGDLCPSNLQTLCRSCNSKKGASLNG